MSQFIVAKNGCFLMSSMPLPVTPERINIHGLHNGVRQALQALGSVYVSF